MAEEKKLLEIENLRKYFPINGVKGPGVQAVQDVSLYIKKGETLGLVGESVLARNLSDCRDNELNLQCMFCTGNILQQTGNPKRAPYQQQGHDPIHQLIVTSVKSFQHVSCKCPN